MGYRKLHNPYACSPCDTRSDACGCCDTGFETGVLELFITGCDGTTSLQQVTVTRYRSAAGLPCGPTSRYPATDPCGVFWGTFSIGDGCDVGSGDWSGVAGVMLWCSDPGAAIPYTEEIYCYDSYLACYVYQGNATITSYECRCNGPYTEVTLPTLDCCCEGPPDCTCEPPTTLYADITTDACGASFESAGPVELTQGLDGCWSATALTPNMPSAIETIDLCCVAGVWQLSILFVPAGCGGEITEDAASGACDPFDLTFSFTLDSACCPAAGGTLTVNVTE